MRLRHVITPLALGLAARAVIRHRRARRSAARFDAFAADPGDPVQALEDAAELQVMPLEVDAVSRADVEAAQDLASLEVELDAISRRDAAEFAEAQVRPRDAGELYGAHTPAAVDRDLPDDDRAFATGQNWIEALETSAIEGGAAPECELEIVDDEDVLSPPHASTARDTPVADHGAGGRRGL